MSEAAPLPFSPDGRKAALEGMAARPLDVLVVGGGITGCGVARDAALRGWRVGLVEKVDFAFGTSGRSSKIVHGGVRYLEYGQVLLVRESARERAVLRAIAPHLVHRIDFQYPVFAPDLLLKIRAGLFLFDRLAGARGRERSRVLEPDEARARLPGLREPLKGSVLYPEYITDDARLTLENAMSAAEHGALVANHARAVELVRAEDGAVVGARVHDELTGREQTVAARCVVNATGPWAESVLESWGLRARKPLRPSKGIHLLISAERLPIQGATFLKAADGRRGLAMRRLDWVYVGTSDEAYHGPLDAPRATRAEVVELLAMVQDCFPEAGLGVDDVLATWAGVRPLIAEGEKSTRDTSREDEVWRGPTGLITVAGGKLTTYRRMGGRVVRALREEIGAPPRDEDRTAEVPLPGAPPGDAAAFRTERHARLLAAGVPPGTADRLCWLYGRQLDDLLALGSEDPRWLQPLAPGIRAVRAEAKLSAEREMACSLADFMDRRSALLLFSRGLGIDAAEPAAAILGEVLGWSDGRRSAEVEAYRELVAEHRVPAAGRGALSGAAPPRESAG